MGGNQDYLGTFEEQLLWAILRLRENAYGVTIRQELEAVTGRATSYGAIYTTLERLEQKGYVSSRQGDPTPERGGRAKKFFHVEGAGLQALAEAERVRSALRSGLQPLGGAT